MADKTTSDMKKKHEVLIDAKLRSMNEQSQKILKAQEDLTREIHQKIGTLGSYADIDKKIKEGFSGFFMKNLETEKLITSIESDKTDIRKELELLKRKVESFNLMTRDKDIKTQMKDIEDQMRVLDKKKYGIRYKVDQLLERIKGK